MCCISLRWQTHIVDNINQVYHIVVPVLSSNGDEICVSMMTWSNGIIFRVTGSLCGEFMGCQWIPLTKEDSDVELWCFLWYPLEELSKQSRRRWFETPSCSLWRHCKGKCMANVIFNIMYGKCYIQYHDLCADYLCFAAAYLIHLNSPYPTSSLIEFNSRVR